MQTFIVDKDIPCSAKKLDVKRLNKQILECWQIYDTIINNKKAWANHPAVRMWRDHTIYLLYYGYIHYLEWQDRWTMHLRTGKYTHKSGEYLKEEYFTKGKIVDQPSWITEEFILSHRSNLIRKLPERYSVFWPDVKDDLEYIWPI